ncbi:hypothetical protein GRF29_77g1740238 [Pseudopithomyces chartarum]|uniref:Aminoglycoside phosphotransferase domain-containing protein n=1 Tax=Pseudopithomyces chartarum TaxID=1892770 RepID=A0AAN6LZ10_9PLEO|nr:hypothetical protein GRF29_77g1740238 [Pseudopithomyces chartarum]
MSHPKDYAQVKPAPRNDSPSLSDSLLTPGQEKRYQFTTPPRKENRFRVIAAFVLFLSLGFNAVWFLGLVSGAHETCYATQETRLVMKDQFANVYKKDNKAWTDLQGGSWGTVYTKENRDDGVVRMGGVAMFHQLHCLDSFRHAIQQLQDGHQIGFDHSTDTAAHKGHWPHCFDYLRQILLCQADDTVETSQLAYTGDWIISGFLCRILKDPDLPELSPSDRRLAWFSIIRTLAKLHSIDPDSIGLSSFGKKSNFYARHCTTFSRIEAQQAQVQDIKTGTPLGRAHPAFDEIVAYIRSNLPAERSCIIHGDYKFDNIVLHPTESRVVAVLDWELSTIGHPLMDCVRRRAYTAFYIPNSRTRAALYISNSCTLAALCTPSTCRTRHRDIILQRFEHVQNSLPTTYGVLIACARRIAVCLIACPFSANIAAAPALIALLYACKRIITTIARILTLWNAKSISICINVLF